MGQGKKNYGDGVLFYGLFIAPKVIYCLTFNQSAIIEEKKRFKGFQDAHRLLVCKQFFDLLEGEKVVVIFE